MFPIPGYIAKLIQAAQVEKMKKVGNGPDFNPRPLTISV